MTLPAESTEDPVPTKMSPLDEDALVPEEMNSLPDEPEEDAPLDRMTIPDFITAFPVPSTSIPEEPREDVPEYKYTFPPENELLLLDEYPADMITSDPLAPVDRPGRIDMPPEV